MRVNHVGREVGRRADTFFRVAGLALLKQVAMVAAPALLARGNASVERCRRHPGMRASQSIQYIIFHLVGDPWMVDFLFI